MVPQCYRNGMAKQQEQALSEAIRAAFDLDRRSERRRILEAFGGGRDIAC